MNTNTQPSTVIFATGNGGYVEAEAARGLCFERAGFEFNGYELIVGGTPYRGRTVVELSPEELLASSFEEVELFRTEAGHVYKAVN